MMSFILKTPRELQMELATRFRELRVLRDLRRSSLAEVSGVPESSIRRFELLGEISLRSLVQLAYALGVEEQFVSLFSRPPAATLDEIERVERRLAGSARKRGRK